MFRVPSVSLLGLLWRWGVAVARFLMHEEERALDIRATGGKNNGVISTEGMLASIGLGQLRIFLECTD